MLSQSERPLLRPWHLWTGLAFALLLGLLAGLPELLRWGLLQGLREQGLRATLEDVDFNPFAGRLIVRDLAVQYGPAPVLALRGLEIELVSCLVSSQHFSASLRDGRARRASEDWPSPMRASATQRDARSVAPSL